MVLFNSLDLMMEMGEESEFDHDDDDDSLMLFYSVVVVFSSVDVYFGKEGFIYILCYEKGYYSGHYVGHLKVLSLFV